MDRSSRDPVAAAQQRRQHHPAVGELVADSRGDGDRHPRHPLGHAERDAVAEERRLREEGRAAKDRADEDEYAPERTRFFRYSAQSSSRATLRSDRSNRSSITASSAGTADSKPSRASASSARAGS